MGNLDDLQRQLSALQSRVDELERSTMPRMSNPLAGHGAAGWFYDPLPYGGLIATTDAQTYSGEDGTGAPTVLIPNDPALAVPQWGGSVYPTNWFNLPILSPATGIFYNNSPIAGSIAWTSFTLTYQGANYTINAGSTPYQFAWWNLATDPNNLQASDTLPDDAADQFLVVLNYSGTARPTEFQNVIYSNYIKVSTLSAITAYLGAAIVDSTLTFGPNGGWFVGSGTFNSPLTGWRCLSVGGVGILEWYNGGVKTLYSKSDGYVYCASDNLRLGINGIEVLSQISSGGALTTPANSPGTVANLAGTGTVAWSNPSNAAASDDSYATANITAGGATDTGATSPGTVADLSGTGTVAWSNPSNAAASDDTYATCALSGTTSTNTGATSAGTGTGWTNSNNIRTSDNTYATTVVVNAEPTFGTSAYLTATNFGFNVPAGATILGITAAIEWKYAGGDGNAAKDTAVYIVKGGGRTGDNKYTNADLPLSDSYRSYGGAADLWGVSSWSAGDINSSGFGVAFQVHTASATNVTVSVDHVRITVYYSVSNTQGHYLKATNLGFAVPSGAAILGVLVEIEKKASAAGVIQDNIVKLVRGGSIVGSNKADTATGWATSDGYISYGGAADLWGVSLTDTDVNATNFGVVIAPKTTSSGTAYIDHVRITIYYQTSANSSSNYLKATNFGFAVPTGATVTSVTVEIERKCDTESVMTDAIVQLVKGGTISGTSRPNASYWGTSDAYQSYSYDLTAGGWNVALTPADVNGATFGVVLSAQTNPAPSIASVDHVRMSVGYTISSNKTPMNLGGFPLQGVGNGVNADDAAAFGQIPIAAVGYAANDVTLSSTSLADITGLSFSIAANEVWSINALLSCAQNSTNGLGVAVNAPSGATLEAYAVGNNTSGTTNIKSRLTALDTVSANTYVNFVGDGYVWIRGTVKNGANAGTVQIRGSRPAGTATIYALSNLVARKLA